MTEIASFAEANRILLGYVPSLTAFKGAYTLERITSLMDRLGNPQHKYKVVHVAGTSGKTSTSYYIASMLRQSGAKVGLTVSPHIDEVNERVQINLKPLPEQKFCRQLSRFISKINQIGIKPTYFELLVAFAYWQFAEDKVDYAVVEVGLGGLLDGTNVVKSSDKVCVVTDIGLDHIEVLGKTISEIAAQKAGIIRPHNTVFCYEQGGEVMSVIREVTDQVKAELHELWPIKSSGLPGNLPLYQRRNWYLALSVFNFIATRDGLSELDESQLGHTTETYIPARMEAVRYKGKIVIMDGAHNDQKMAAFIESVRKNYPKENIAALVSIMQGKKSRTIGALNHITKFANHITLTSFGGQQDLPKSSVDPLKLAEYCEELDFHEWEVIKQPELALASIVKRPEKIILVTGSFYLLNHIRPVILKADD